jgi:hypothetical protein
MRGTRRLVGLPVFIDDRRILRRVVLLTVLGVALGACSDRENDSGAADGRTEPAVTETTTTTTRPAANPGAEAAVLSGYRAFWDAYVAAGDPMNPEDPRLRAHSVGEELETVQKAFLARRSAGEVIRGSLELAPKVSAVAPDGNTATVTDCYLDRTGIYDAATGTRKDTESGVRHRVRVQMLLHEGVWKVASIALEGDGCTPAA